MKLSLVGLLFAAAPFAVNGIVDGSVELEFYVNCLQEVVRAECDVDIDRRFLKKAKRNLRRLIDEEEAVAFTDCDVEDRDDLELTEFMLHYEDIEYDETSTDEEGEEVEVEVVTRSISSELVLTELPIQEGDSSVVLARGYKHLVVTIREDPVTLDEYVDRIQTLEVSWDQSIDCGLGRAAPIADPLNQGVPYSDSKSKKH